MKTQHTTIGMVAKRFASVVCLLSAVLAFAPSAQADTVACTNCLTFSAEEPFGLILEKGTKSGTAYDGDKAPFVNLEWSPTG